MKLHELLRPEVPRLAECLAARATEPYLVEHVLPPATNADVRRLESELGASLPASYKRLLMVTRGFWLSGGMVQLSKTHPFFHDWAPLETLTPEQRRVVQRRGGRWPPPTGGMLCFAEYFLEADGDQVLWDVSAGLVEGEYPVMYYAHERPSVRRIAASFREWLEHCLDAFPPADDEDR